MQLDFTARELTVKLVFYGPALSGKTTNLQAVHDLVSQEARGRLMTLETKDDRTLFFDLLPLAFQTGSDLNLRFKLFTVPGQVIHSATRRLVLRGADGIAFIADSRVSETRANQAAFLDMKQNLRDNGFDPEKVPLVIQFNKRDLADVRTDAEIDALAERGQEPVYKAIAIRGTGVLETLVGLIRRTWTQLEAEHGLSEKFGLDGQRVIEDIAARLGVPGPSNPSGSGEASS